MAAFAAHLGHCRLSRVRCRNVPRTQRDTRLFQERSETVFGDELRRAATLHSRSTAERIRRGAPESAVAEETFLSGDHSGDGHTSDSLCLNHWKKRNSHGSGRGVGDCSFLYRGIASVRGDGRLKPVTARAGGVVPRSDFLSARRIFDLEGSHVANSQVAPPSRRPAELRPTRLQSLP